MLCYVLDLIYLALRVTSRFIDFRLRAMDCCKNILKYLRSTKDLFLIFGEISKLRVERYIDVDGRMSTSVYIIELCWFGMLKKFQATDQWKLI